MKAPARSPFARPSQARRALDARPRPVVAVLAVQGAFVEHEHRLEQLGCACIELRQAADLARPFDALVLPGGESTTQAKLLRDLEMLDPLRERIAAGLPTLGTCAGLILLAEHVISGGIPEEPPTKGGGVQAACNGQAAACGCEGAAAGAFATLPATVQRNAYGRQLSSFRVFAPFGDAAEGGPEAIPMTFIRAPRITTLHAGARPLADLGGETVAVQAGNQIGCAFHPELDDSNVVYEHFLALVLGRRDDWPSRPAKPGM